MRRWMAQAGWFWLGVRNRHGLWRKPQPRAWSFDVETTTHDLLKLGITAHKWYGSPNRHRRIVVLADSHEEAEDLVFALVFGRGHYLTRIYDRI